MRHVKAPVLGVNPEDVENDPQYDIRAEAWLVLGDAAEEWLAAPNSRFDGYSPNELMNGTGKQSQQGLDRVREVLRALRYGSFS